MTTQGQFFIINTGAGDKDNITLKGHRIMQSADLIIASAGQRQRFADEIADKEVIDGGHGLFTNMVRRHVSEEEAQEKEQAMRDKINGAYEAGQIIVLMESGDISLYSPYRGYLDAFAHLKPQLIPGVSSFNAANAALALPLLSDEADRLQLSGLKALDHTTPETAPNTWVLFCMQLDMARTTERIQTLYSSDTELAFIHNAGTQNCHVMTTTVGQLDQFTDEDIDWPRCLLYIGFDSTSGST